MILRNINFTSHTKTDKSDRLRRIESCDDWKCKHNLAALSYLQHIYHDIPSMKIAKSNKMSCFFNTFTIGVVMRQSDDHNTFPHLCFTGHERDTLKTFRCWLRQRTVEFILKASFYCVSGVEEKWNFQWIWRRLREINIRKFCEKLILTLFCGKIIESIEWIWWIIEKIWTNSRFIRMLCTYLYIYCWLALTSLAFKDFKIVSHTIHLSYIIYAVNSM